MLASVALPINASRRPTLAARELSNVVTRSAVVLARSFRAGAAHAFTLRIVVSRFIGTVTALVSAQSHFVARMPKESRMGRDAIAFHPTERPRTSRALIECHASSTRA